MSDKLFEYKDPQDWYIAQWGEDADYNQFSQVPAEASTLLDQLELLFAKDPEGFPLNLSVMRYGSAFRFLTFLTEILNEVKGRAFEIVQRQGALLLVEKGKLLYLHLPSDGVDLEAFLGQDKVKDTILIATRNEGKTKEFRNMFEKAAGMNGITGEILLQSLECRLDNVVFRLGIAPTRAAARQLVGHKHITVDGKVVNIPSYAVKPGQIVGVRERSKSLEVIANSLAGFNHSKYPWLEWDESSKVGKLLHIPERADIPENIKEHLIVELYSK